MRNFATVKELYDAFMLNQSYRNNSKRTIEYYKENLERFFQWLQSEELLALSIENWEKYGVYLKQLTKKNGDKYSDASIQDAMRAIKAFYNYGVKQKVLEKDLSGDLHLPKAREKVVKILNDSEIELVFNKIGSSTQIGLRNSCIVALMIDSGLRRGEISNINFEDLDDEYNSIVIKGKGNKQRVVPIGKVSANLLQKYINQYRQNCNGLSPLFVGIDNKRVTDNLIKQFFKRLKKSTGIMRLHPHLLRHTFATNYIVDGGDLETLRIILGHENIQTTQRYLHMANDLKLQNSRHNSHLDKITHFNKTDKKTA